MTNTLTISRELAPCPFCGGVPEITKHFRQESYGFTHRCPIVGPISWGFRESAQSHIDMWNTRAAPAVERQPDAWRYAVNGMWQWCADREEAVRELAEYHADCSQEEILELKADGIYYPQPLYTSPPAPVAMALPDRREPTQDYPYLTYGDIEWNACLDKVKEMNQ